MYLLYLLAKFFIQRNLYAFLVSSSIEVFGVSIWKSDEMTAPIPITNFCFWLKVLVINKYFKSFRNCFLKVSQFRKDTKGYFLTQTIRTKNEGETDS